MFRRYLLKEGIEGVKKERESPCPAPSAEETLLRCRDLASSLRLLRADCLNTGLELLRRIQERLLAILQHSTQVWRPNPGPPVPITAPALGAYRRKGSVSEWMLRDLGMCPSILLDAAGASHVTMWHCLQNKGVSPGLDQGYLARCLLIRITWQIFTESQE